MLKSNQKPKVLILMSGSIACYKACSLLSMLVKNNFEVKVAASASALQFVGETTIEGLIGNPVHTDLWKKGSAMEHIQLERWADIIIAVPATAHFINRIAHGTGDDLLTTLFLAHEFKKPFLIAPAMNTAMYLHPITQNSIKKLNTFGIKILESASGVLACGETGYGKLLEPDLLFEEIQNSLSIFAPKTKDFPTFEVTKNILVTAGGTREPLDDVRYIGNASTGLTGERIATILSELGFNVTLDLAESATIKTNFLYQVKKFDSFSSLSILLQNQLQEESFDLVIHAAAVSDFSVEKSVGKISSDDDLVINLKKNPKLVNQIKNWSRNKNTKLIAFKLTSQATDEQILTKVEKIIKEANAEVVVHNDIDAKKDRKNHQFKIFKKNHKIEVIGINELVSEIMKVGFL